MSIKNSKSPGVCVFLSALLAPEGLRVVPWGGGKVYRTQSSTDSFDIAGALGGGPGEAWA